MYIAIKSLRAIISMSKTIQPLISSLKDGKKINVQLLELETLDLIYKKKITCQFPKEIPPKKQTNCLA